MVAEDIAQAFVAQRCATGREINILSRETEVEYGSFLKICKVVRAGEVLDVEEATLP